MTTNTSPSTPLAPAIVLNLVNSNPCQSWTFESARQIRIGRATDNDIILFSAVVSRHHAELRWSASTGWQMANLSSNRTYVNAQPIDTIAVKDGMVFRLATSGPKIAIKLLERETNLELIANS
jgi:pSer/pThr/pTyr-binding forkhead associated (FHA) protein